VVGLDSVRGERLQNFQWNEEVLGLIYSPFLVIMEALVGEKAGNLCVAGGSRWWAVGCGRLSRLWGYAGMMEVGCWMSWFVRG
jgi:hypothetical protein